MKAGRPSDYNEDIAKVICDRLSVGESLRQICLSNDMPDRITVIRWCAKFPEFATNIAHAREEQADYMDDRILEISNQVLDGQVDANAGRVAIAAFQWRAGKLKPKKYGDTRAHEQAPTVTNNMIITSQVLDLLGQDQLEALRVKLGAAQSLPQPAEQPDGKQVLEGDYTSTVSE